MRNGSDNRPISAWTRPRNATSRGSGPGAAAAAPSPTRRSSCASATPGRGTATRRGARRCTASGPARPDPDRPRVPHQFEERHLVRVLGLVGVVEDAAADPPDDRTVPPDDRLERRPVPPGHEAIQQMLVGHRLDPREAGRPRDAGRAASTEGRAPASRTGDGRLADSPRPRGPAGGRCGSRGGVGVGSPDRHRLAKKPLGPRPGGRASRTRHGPRRIGGRPVYAPRAWAGHAEPTRRCAGLVRSPPRVGGVQRMGAATPPRRRELRRRSETVAPPRIAATEAKTSPIVAVLRPEAPSSCAGTACAGPPPACPGSRRGTAGCPADGASARGASATRGRPCRPSSPDSCRRGRPSVIWNPAPARSPGGRTPGGRTFGEVEGTGDVAIPQVRGDRLPGPRGKATPSVAARPGRVPVPAPTPPRAALS